MTNIITSPKVYLLSAPMFFAVPGCILPKDGCSEERIIATAGKICYDSYGEDGRPVKEHVKGLCGQGHGSVLEHVNIGVVMFGISRGCSHEIVRHRAGCSYSQRSTRYADEDDCAMVLEPGYAAIYGKLDPTPVENKLLNEHINGFESQRELYGQQVLEWLSIAPEDMNKTQQRKWARGKARQNLPHALETRLVMTANIRAWRHFITMRSHRSAEAEIRRLAHVVWPIISDAAPAAFADAKIQYVDGYVEIACPNV